MDAFCLFGTVWSCTGLQNLMQYVLTFLSRGQITMNLRIPESKLPLHETVEQIDSIKDTSGIQDWIEVLQQMKILGMRVNRRAYLTLLHRPWRCKIKFSAQCKNLTSVQSPSPALLQWSNPCFSGTGHCWLDQNLRSNVLLYKCRLILATNQPCHSTTIISNQPHLSAFGFMQCNWKFHLFLWFNSCLIWLLACCNRQI